MERKDRRPSAWGHDAGELFQKAVKHFKFAVDVDPQGLEAPLTGFHHCFLSIFLREKSQRCLDGLFKLGGGPYIFLFPVPF